jgi:hypothetical protein
MEDSNAVPVGSPVGQNKPSEPIGDKNRITSMARKKGQWWSVKDVVGKESKSMGENWCAWRLGFGHEVEEWEATVAGRVVVGLVSR